MNTDRVVGLGDISRSIDSFSKQVNDEMTLMKKDKKYLNESEQNKITESTHNLINMLNEFITFINREEVEQVDNEEEVVGGRRRAHNRRRHTRRTRKHKRSNKIKSK